MIEYNLKEQGIDILDTVLTNRGLTISQIKDMLSPRKEFEEPSANYKDMDRAIERLALAIKQGEKIATLVDEDLDGFTSSSLIFNFIKEDLGYENMDCIFQDRAKVHGLNEYVINKVFEKEITLLITPDSSSSDFEYQELLNKMGISLIVLDHHQFEQKEVSKHTILINNQDGIVNNVSLSGCGVTYKFVKAFSDRFGIDIGNKYLDLVALSLIGDVMNMTSLENRYFFSIGSKIENISNLFIQSFVDKNKIEERISIEEFGFSISPLINATIRIGSKEEKELLFKSLLNQEILVESKKRGAKGEIVPIQQEAIRIATNLKSKQDKLKKSSSELILNKFGRKIEDKVFIEIVENEMESSISGLIANRLVDLYKKPVILLKYNKELECYTGSARTVNGIEEVEQFKKICLETEEFKFAKGHEGAFGVAIDKENIHNAKEKLNKKLENVEFKTKYEVEGEFKEKVSLSEVKPIAELEELWCNNVPSPLFVVKDVRLHTNNIEKIGNATYTFKLGDVKFTKNFGSKVWYEDVIKINLLPFGGNIIADIVCRFRKNKKGYYWCEIVKMVTREDEEAIDF